MPSTLAKRKKNPVAVRGIWIPMPLEFLRSRAFAEFSPYAAKMFLDLCACLGPNASGNGDLAAAPAIMFPKGWRSTATRVAALKELEEAQVIAITKRGNRRAPTLYAITLWPLQCDFAKLDYGPGCCSTLDWFKSDPGRAESPTIEKPAKWRSLRKNENGPPTAGPKP